MNLSVMFLGVILLTGLFVLTLPTDSFAVSEKGAEKGKAKGCEKDNPNQAKNNPHCDVTPPCDVNAPGDCDNDSIPNSEDACPLTPVGDLGQSVHDWDGDNVANEIDSDPCDPFRN